MLVDNGPFSDILLWQRLQQQQQQQQHKIKNGQAHIIQFVYTKTVQISTQNEYRYNYLFSSIFGFEFCRFVELDSMEFLSPPSQTLSFRSSCFSFFFSLVFCSVSFEMGSYNLTIISRLKIITELSNNNNNNTYTDKHTIIALKCKQHLGCDNNGK